MKSILLLLMMMIVELWKRQTQRQRPSEILSCRESTVLLHDAQELDDDFGRGLEKHLPFAPLLGIEHVLQRIVEHTDSHHCALPAATSITHIILLLIFPLLFSSIVFTRNGQQQKKNGKNDRRICCRQISTPR